MKAMPRAASRSLTVPCGSSTIRSPLASRGLRPRLGIDDPHRLDVAENLLAAAAASEDELAGRALRDRAGPWKAMSNSRCSQAASANVFFSPATGLPSTSNCHAASIGSAKRVSLKSLSVRATGAAGTERPVPLAAEQGHGLLRIAVQAAVLAAAGAELPAGDALPAEALGHHLGEQAAAALRGGPPAGKARLPAELAHLARRVPAHEETLAHENRLVQRQRETLLLVGE